MQGAIKGEGAQTHALSVVEARKMSPENLSRNSVKRMPVRHFKLKCVNERAKRGEARGGSPGIDPIAQIQRQKMSAREAGSSLMSVSSKQQNENELLN